MPAPIPNRDFSRSISLGKFAAALLPCLVLACHTQAVNEGAEDAAQGPGATGCMSSRDCAPGQSCVRGACVQAADCASRGCAAGQVCGQSGQCLTLREACAAEGGCECHIVDMAGQLAGEGSAHVLGAGQRLQPQVVFVTRRGALINTTPEVLTVQDSAGQPAANFAVHDNKVVEATAGTGTATLTARADTVTCEARLHNLGAAPGAGRLRFYLYDAVTGHPVANATVLVDTTETGQDTGQARPTDVAGLTHTEQAIERPYTATIFAAGYVYTSFVGLDPATAFDLKVPLTALHTSFDPPDAATVPTQRRSVDFSQYEQSELDGGSSGLHLALGGTSLPLASLVGSLSGGMGTGALDPTQSLPPGTPSFSVTLPESDVPLELPIPGPLFLASSDPAVRANLPQKDYLELPDTGALRLPWVLGGEFGATEMLLLKGALNQLVLAKFTALQDAHTAPRDAMETLMQLLPKLSLGLGSHNDRADDAAQPLVLRAPLRQFSNLHVPAFPADSTLDTLLVVSGVNAPGLGFVPLGLGVGVDCLEGACLSTAGTFTHHVQGLNLCALGRCAAGVPPKTENDHLAFFAAQPFAGLESQPRLTVALALGVHTLEAQTVEFSGWVLPQMPQPGASELLAAQAYLPLPQVPQALVNRRYVFAQPSPGEGAAAPTVPLHFIRFVGLGDEAQWHVFAGAQATSFVAPPVPASWGDFPETLYAAHLQLQLDAQGPSVELGALLQQGGGLSSFAERVRAFALRSQEIACEAPQILP
jgi:hypothetical protein